MKRLTYQSAFCEELLRFFDRAPFQVTEVQKKDGSVTLVETATELPTFEGFAQKIGTTRQQLNMWAEKYPAFAHACAQARDKQADILIQNSLRGNYTASFAVFMAKNLLGWKEKNTPVQSMGVEWDETSSEN